MGSENPEFSSVPLLVKGLGGKVLQVATGVQHACALLNRSIECWGDSSDNVFGADGIKIGKNYNNPVPAKIEFDLNAENSEVQNDQEKKTIANPLVSSVEKPPPPKKFEWHPLQSFIAYVKEQYAASRNTLAKTAQPPDKTLVPPVKSATKPTQTVISSVNFDTKCAPKLKDIDRQFKSENKQQQLITEVLKANYFVECVVPIKPFKDQWMDANAKTINAYFATLIFADKGSEMKKQYQLMITSSKIVYDRLLQISDDPEYQQSREKLNSSLTTLEKYVSQLPSSPASSNNSNLKTQRCEFTNKMASRTVKGTRNVGEVVIYFEDSGLYMDFDTEYLDMPNHQLMICTPDSWQECNTDSVLKCQKKFNYECNENSICEEVN